MKVVAPTGAARRRLGLALASQTPLQFRFPPRRGALRAKSPKAGELCVAPRVAAPSGSPDGEGDTLGAGALGSCLAFPKRARLGLPTPPRRARCDECASLVPKVALRALRGGSPFKVVAQPLFLCFAPLADFPRTGRNAGGEAAQNRARQFRVKQVYSESAALGFPPPAGVAPLSIERDKTAHD
mgnify:CR=1 FL=1